MSVFTEEFPLNQESEIETLLRKKHGDVVIMERKRIYPIWFLSKPRVRIVGYSKGQDSRKTLDSITQKIDSLQTQLTFGQHKSNPDSSIALIEDDLRSMGFSQSYISDALQFFKQTMTVSQIHEYETLQSVCHERFRKQVHALMTPIDWNVARGIFVFGNTGVGKTSILSKIAIAIRKHEFETLRDVSLVFVNHDTYKIGAMEQIESIATLLESQCMACATKEDIAHILRERKRTRYLLIDSPGANPHSLDLLGSLQSYKDEKKILRFLVLSAGASADEVRFAIRQYECLRPDAVFITKCDEVINCAPVMAACIEHGMPIAYISTSPSFTKGLEKIAEDKILDVLSQKWKKRK